MKKCKRCGEDSSKYGKGIFCSKKCQGIAALNSKKSIKKRELVLKATKVRIKIIKNCQKCNKEFEILACLDKNGEPVRIKRETKCCSIKCAKSRNHTEEQNQKRREKLTIKNKKIFKRICKNEKCNNEFELKRKQSNKLYCCVNCRNTDIVYINKLRENGKRQALSKNFLGWPKRYKYKQSYPEIFFENVLLNNNITSYKKELKCSKYFLDFAFEDCKIDLEIDGKQHEYEDRKIKDIERDKFLTSIGWKVYRIKWENPITDAKKQYIKNEIDKFLDFYNKNSEMV